MQPILAINLFFVILYARGQWNLFENILRFFYIKKSGNGEKKE